jgi:hypothetical protein
MIRRKFKGEGRGRALENVEKKKKICRKKKKGKGMKTVSLIISVIP